MATKKLATADLPFLDIHGKEFNSNPHEVLAQLRRQSPVAKSQRGFEVLRYETLNWMLQADEFDIPSAEHTVNMGGGPLQESFDRYGRLPALPRDQHARIRRVMGQAFSLRRIAERRELMADVANGLVDTFINRGECDFIADFTHHYSVTVACLLFGVDTKDVPSFQNATATLAHMFSVPLAPHVPAIEAALKVLWDYLEPLVESRSREPKDDFVSVIVEAQKAQGKLSKEELIWGLTNLLFAGHDSTRSQLANFVRAVVRHPGTWELMLNDPEQIPFVMHESIRFYPTVQANKRVVRSTVDFDGFHAEAGQLIYLNTLSASRDPERFDNPNTYDVSRPIDSYNTGFGHGIHHCLGHVLAKTEMIVAMTVLLERLENVQLNGSLESMPYSGQLGSLLKLPLKFNARCN
ncbi:cytochrome P450 [Sphingorhabdus contaminans]|uniref:Cytochrome P450 n=1 Tax=Sphingorhabdus contaminans TaxID=1343899 RepID=A0A553WCB8_9SPHN|nr:cytochrome P450 [Sphingorhabdus contaminans]TSB02338.1 cytochrome P450 [Sphingorhabdus contaminans]